MCFFKFIDEDDCVHYKHEVSDTDIICYKTVEARPGSDDYRSRIQGFKYEVGKTYTEDSVPMDLLEKLDMLNDGVFHSYTELTVKFLEKLACINERIRRLNSTRYGPDENLIFIMKCVIPAGTPYWVNPVYLEYASTAIRPIEILDPSDDTLW